jgi:outer membrane protein assembly factor BamD
VSFCALSTVLVVAGCSSTPVDPTTNWSPNKIYSEASDEREAGNFDKAIGLYEKLEGRAAGTPLAQQAQLDKAYTQYKGGEQAQALATLERFLRLHPASPALDYALYLKGLVNFNENLGLFGSLAQQDLSERDQKAAKESFESLREVVTRFPDSRYAPDARARMTYIEFAGAIRGACGALLLWSWRLPGGDQPGTNRRERLRQHTGHGRGAGHSRSQLRRPGHDPTAR